LRGTLLGRLTTGLVLCVCTMFVVQSVFVSLGSLTGGDRKASISADEPTTLRVGMLQAATNMNPYNADEDADYVVFGLIYDRLIMYDENLDPQPLIATSWESDRWPEADDPSTPNIDEGADCHWMQFQ